MTARPTRERGPHPDDAGAFAPAQHATLRRAVAELSWLLSRGYNPKTALTFVGDRYQLTRRQRLGVGQAACADQRIAARATSRLDVADLRGRALRIDGFNCVITLEAALCGALTLVGRDGVYRDLSRLRGSYRLVAPTRHSVRLVGALLADAQVASVQWCLDRPVSNSGRLRALLLDEADRAGWPWTARLSDRTDREVAAAPDVAASSDSWILDQGVPWVDLPGALIADQLPGTWVIDLR
ncbi:MAG: hypothetical protein CSA66_02745 [Proteobacteria bacterium]|nr:MAG: hypothetical protein CSA66_02745 [Pseudomonadota bacterium]